MFKLDPRMISDFFNKDLIAFGTGGLGKLMLLYSVKEPDIRLHGVTNSRVTEEDAGTFLDTGLPIRSLAAWAKRMPDAVILLCVVRKNEAAARAACEAAGFHKILPVTLDVTEMMQDLMFGGEWPTGHPAFHYACMANELHDVHRASFAEFRGCHRGETVAVVGSGPSMNYYTQLEGVPHVGVNNTIFREDIHLDYYFVWDYERGKTEKIKNYDAIKFMGRNEWDSVNYKIPEFIFEENHARRFFTGRPSHYIYSDIEHYPLMGFHSVIFSAIHFAMFTRPRKLLLIGCDCSSDGHFDGDTTPIEWALPLWMNGYEKLKRFVAWNYPDMEIISVNPVGLKGMFHDMYTESYLDAHPELDRTKCELLTQEALAAGL